MRTFILALLFGPLHALFSGLWGWLLTWVAVIALVIVDVKLQSLGLIFLFIYALCAPGAVARKVDRKVDVMARAIKRAAQ